MDVCSISNVGGGDTTSAVAIGSRLGGGGGASAAPSTVNPWTMGEAPTAAFEALNAIFFWLLRNVKAPMLAKATSPTVATITIINVFSPPSSTWL